jgi:hypothetical protein
MDELVLIIEIKFQVVMKPHCTGGAGRVEIVLILKNDLNPAIGL